LSGNHIEGFLIIWIGKLFVNYLSELDKILKKRDIQGERNKLEDKFTQLSAE
jgi:hypothetical protein